jgi:hypothetical protein
MARVTMYPMFECIVLMLLIRFFSRDSSCSYSSAEISPESYFSRREREWLVGRSVLVYQTELDVAYGVLRARRGNAAA